MEHSPELGPWSHHVPSRPLPLPTLPRLPELQTPSSANRSLPMPNSSSVVAHAGTKPSPENETANDIQVFVVRLFVI